MSPECAAALVANFKIVLTAFDNDKVGIAATTTCKNQLESAKVRNPMLACIAALPIKDGKDLGEMRQDVADDLIKLHVAKESRGF